MSVLKFFTLLKASLTFLMLYVSPLMVSRAWVAILPWTKPIWLNEPSGMSGAYFFRIDRYRTVSGLFELVSVSSALTPSLFSQRSPSASAMKSVLHGVEQDHLTRSWRPCCCAA